MESVFLCIFLDVPATFEYIYSSNGICVSVSLCLYSVAQIKITSFQVGWPLIRGRNQYIYG